MLRSRMLRTPQPRLSTDAIATAPHIFPVTSVVNAYQAFLQRNSSLSALLPAHTILNLACHADHSASGTQMEGGHDGLACMQPGGGSCQGYGKPYSTLCAQQHLKVHTHPAHDDLAGIKNSRWHGVSCRLMQLLCICYSCKTVGKSSTPAPLMKVAICHMLLCASGDCAICLQLSKVHCNAAAARQPVRGCFCSVQGHESQTTC